MCSLAVVLSRCPTLSRPPLSWPQGRETCFRGCLSFRPDGQLPRDGAEAARSQHPQLLQPQGHAQPFHWGKAIRQAVQWEENKTSQESRAKTPSPACFVTAANQTLSGPRLFHLLKKSWLTWASGSQSWLCISTTCDLYLVPTQPTYKELLRVRAY